MSEFIGLEKIPRDLEGMPMWHRAWGDKFKRDRRIFDNIYLQTLDQPLEERDKLLRIAKEEVVSLRNQWRHLVREERAEAWALCSKYNHPETGTFAGAIREYETRMADLETRLPFLAKWIKDVEHPENRLISWQTTKLMLGDDDDGKPTVVFNHGWFLPPYSIAPQGIDAVKNHLIKRTTLLEEQNQVLISAFEENGIQMPREFDAIRSKIDALKRFSPDEPAQADEPGQKTGQQRGKSYIRPVELLEEPIGSEFTVGYEVLEKPKLFDPKTWSPSPPRGPPPEEMEREDLQEFLKSMRRFKCGKFFETLATQERSDKYHDLVRDHRDLATIKADLEKPTYRAQAFFEDIRLMLDNYSRYLDEGSDQHKMVALFEEAMFKKLDEWGEAGQTAKDQFHNARRAEFNEIIPSPKADETFQPSEENDLVEYVSDDQDEAETSYAQGVNNDYNEDYGEEQEHSFFGKNDEIINYEEDRSHFPQTPGTVGPARKFGSQGGLVDQSPSVPDPADQSLDEDERERLAWGGMDAGTQWNEAHGLPTRAPAGLGRVAEQRDNDGDSDPLSSIASPTPSPASRPTTVAARGESGDEDAHAGAHAVEQSAPIAPMSAEQELIDLTSSPLRQTSNGDRASTKRARASEDQDSSSDDDAPLIKRQKTIAESSSDDDAPLIKPQKTTAEPSSDGAPLPSKRQKTAAKSTGYAVTPSLGKRSRDEGDEGDEDRGQPSKRNKASPVLEPQAPAAAAAGDDGPQHTSLTIDELFAPFDSPPPPVQGSPRPRTAATAAQGEKPSLASYQNRSTQNVIQRDALLPPSPIPEPFTPPAAATEGPGSVSPPHRLDGTETREPANNVSANEGHESRPASSSPIAAAEEPQPEPATVDLGHTSNGTTTASKLQKLAKYKKTRGSNGRGRPSRPWVFGHRFGNDYGLYIMSCPKKGCETGVEVFTTHPLMRNDAADHLQECGYDFADDDEMVRKYGTQVINDARKTVSIEWARNWNNELMKEYGNEDREEDNF